MSLTADLRNFSAPRLGQMLKSLHGQIPPKGQMKLSLRTDQLNWKFWIYISGYSWIFLSLRGFSVIFYNPCSSVIFPDSLGYSMIFPDSLGYWRTFHAIPGHYMIFQEGSWYSRIFHDMVPGYSRILQCISWYYVYSNIFQDSYENTRIFQDIPWYSRFSWI